MSKNTPKVLPKRKPKATATSTNRRTGATRGAGDDKEYMRKAAAANMEDGGEAMGRTTTEITKGMMDAMRKLEKSGKRLKPIRPRNNFPSAEQRRKMQDIEFIRDGIEMIPVTKKEDGGKVISGADKNRIRNIFQQPKNILDEIGKTISDADRKKGVQRPRKKFTDSGRGISDADRKKIIDLMGMEDGGAVPKKYKGFSKLPERVQQKIDPDLAGKYEDGGEVRGMGRAYQGKPRGCKIR